MGARRASAPARVTRRFATPHDIDARTGGDEVGLGRLRPVFGEDLAKEILELIAHSPQLAPERLASAAGFLLPVTAVLDDQHVGKAASTKTVQRRRFVALNV